MSIACKPSKEPGVCFACRHANQNTEDFETGYVFCKFLPGKREWKSPCEARVHALYLYEPFDGTNSTWAIEDDELAFDEG